MPATFTKTFDTPTYKGTVTVPLGLYINGKHVDPVEGGSIECVTTVIPAFDAHANSYPELLIHVCLSVS